MSCESGSTAACRAVWRAAAPNGCASIGLCSSRDDEGLLFGGQVAVMLVVFGGGVGHGDNGGSGLQIEPVAFEDPVPAVSPGVAERPSGD